MTAKKLSSLVEEENTSNIKEEKSPPAQKLSRLSKFGGVSETPSEKLRSDTLLPIVKYFIWSSASIILLILALAILEIIFSPGIINDKVIIAVIAGMTIQTSAIIIAAFKGLFKI